MNTAVQTPTPLVLRKTHPRLEPTATLAELPYLFTSTVHTALKRTFKRAPAGRTEPTATVTANVVDTLNTYRTQTRTLGPDLRLVALGRDKTPAVRKNFKHFSKAWLGSQDCVELGRHLLRTDTVGGFGVETGTYGNKCLVVIDLDGNREEQDAILSALNTPTFLVRTPKRKGLHLYFWSNSPVGCPRKWRAAGANIDVKGIGGYVVAPGYTLQDYGTYAADTTNPWFRSNVAALPACWESVLDAFIPVTQPVSSLSLTQLQEREPQTQSTCYSPPKSPGFKATAVLSLIESGTTIAKGSRFTTALRYVSALQLTGNTQLQATTKLEQLRDNQFEEPTTFGNHELNRVVSWIYSPTRERTRQQSTCYSPHKSKLSSYDKELSTLLSKTEQHTASVSDLAPLYRSFLVAKGARWTTPGEKTVSITLRLLGFTAKGVNVKTAAGRSKVNRWNVDATALVAFLANMNATAPSSSTNVTKQPAATSVATALPSPPVGLLNEPCLLDRLDALMVQPPKPVDQWEELRREMRAMRRGNDRPLSESPSPIYSKGLAP